MKNLKINKYLISLLITGSITLGAGSFTVANAEFMTQGDYIVASSGINMRLSNDVEATRIGGIEISQVAERLLTTENGWDLVRYNNHLGFVCGDFTMRYGSDSSSNYTYKEMKTRGIIKKNDVNLRLGPSLEYGIQEALAIDTEVDVLGKADNGWYLVRTDTLLGFVREDMIEVLSYDVYSDYSLGNNFAQVVPVVQATANTKIYNGPSEGAMQLDLLRTGYTLKIISRQQNGWYEVAYNEGSAYVPGTTVIETLGIEGSIQKVISVTTDATLYDAPNGNSIGLVPQYETGEVFGTYQDYYLVRTYENQVGYIKKTAAKVLTSTVTIVDKSDQVAIAYSSNQIVFSSPTVTGLDNPERQSDEGIFQIYSKERDRYLTDGETYNSYVNVWMPYNGGEGLHDATWRTHFGGEIYKTNGSHGCVNLPYDKALELYDIMSVGDNVVVKR